MPRFFFDLSTPEQFERDEVGLMFASFETAYLEACRGAIDLSFDLLRERKDPGAYHFEIRDEQGQFVLELPFSEVLQPGRGTKPYQFEAHHRLQAALERSRKLKSELRDVLAQARESAIRGLELAKTDWAGTGRSDEAPPSGSPADPSHTSQ